MKNQNIGRVMKWAHLRPFISIIDEHSIYLISLLSLTTNLHSCSQQVSEGGQLLLVVLHGLGEVHEVVQIDRIVLSLLVEEVQVVRLVWKLKNQLRPIEVR